MNSGLGLSLLSLAFGNANFRPAAPQPRTSWRKAKRDRAAESRTKSAKQIKKEKRAQKLRVAALEMKFKADHEMRARVAGCRVNELHNKKNRWVLNDAKFNAALQG